MKLLATLAAALAGLAASASADTITVGKAVPFAWTFIPLDVGQAAGIWKKLQAAKSHLWQRPRRHELDGPRGAPLASAVFQKPIAD